MAVTNLVDEGINLHNNGESAPIKFLTGTGTPVGDTVLGLDKEFNVGRTMYFDTASGVFWIKRATGATGWNSTGGSGIVPIAEETITAGTGGAVSILAFHTKLESDAGGDAGSLANGTVIGQTKEITFVTDGGGDWVLTPVNLSGGTTITYADIGDHTKLEWDGTNWVMIKSINLADGTTAPVLA